MTNQLERTLELVADALDDAEEAYEILEDAYRKSGFKRSIELRLDKAADTVDSREAEWRSALDAWERG